MSILLDALKKSEQERQLGQTPTLNTNPQGPEPVRDPGKPLILFALVVISAGVMAWFGWQQLRPPEPAETLAISTRSGQEPSTPARGEQLPRTMTEQYQADTGESPSSDTRKPAPDASASEARAQLSQSVSEFKAEKDSAQAAAQPAENRIVAESPPKPVNNTAIAGSQPDRSAQAAPVQSDTRITPETGDNRRKGMEPHISEPISYWELPQGIRDSLGDIKITVLVYSDQPSDRFVLSNGQRLVEKDQLDGGLVLEEIRRDGAVFVYRNYRFLVKG